MVLNFVNNETNLVHAEYYKYRHICMYLHFRLI